LMYHPAPVFAGHIDPISVPGSAGKLAAPMKHRSEAFKPSFWTASLAFHMSDVGVRL